MKLIEASRLEGASELQILWRIGMLLLTAFIVLGKYWCGDLTAGANKG